MHLASLRIITADVDRLVAFYERVTGLAARRPAPQFAEFAGPAGSATLAIGSAETMTLFGPGAAVPESNRTVIVEFQVADVDAEHDRLRPLLDEVVQHPTTMPWGNRSLLFRDPDGNLVNLFAPVTEAAKARLAR
ncbi:VOC family protein [Amycolatopsis benzoatilytica]|uniref:VOC family protein n=1 Tax=Amycolatopsis benzoatilytica TaxID=346045 RepID=UPI00035FCECB|nr:VOC family protein [Amycolatopsis benzoatilytica]